MLYEFSAVEGCCNCIASFAHEQELPSPHKIKHIIMTLQQIRILHFLHHQVLHNFHLP